MQHPILIGSIQTLRELETAIRKLDDQAYQMPLDVLSGSSIGQHVRHVAEFYLCLIEQFSSTLIAYHLRRRDGSLETQRTLAIQTCNILVDQLEQQWEDIPLALVMENSAINGNVQPINTSLFRELLYCLEHAIHHMAILKIGLAEVAPHIELPQHFGVAPSTIAFREHSCAQ